MNQKISLYFTAEGSDKEYHAQLQAKDSGFVVNFQYGARGSAMKAGTKTAEPIAYEKALKVYEKLVAEKTGKGYTPSESGVAFQDTEKSTQFTGIVPQLLNAIDGCDDLIADDEWFMQPKLDGERRLLWVKSSGNASSVVGINKKGLSVALPQPLADCAIQLRDSCVIDGEMIGNCLYAFDILECGGVDLRKLSAKDRYESLVKILTLAGSESLKIVPAAFTAESKKIMLKSLQDENQEGAVLKRIGSEYVPGRPNSMGDQLKLKFWKSVTVVVGAKSSDKRSVSVCVINANGDVVDVGKVTIPPNKAIPNEGAFAEIKYLYAHEGGSLFQPEYLSERQDVDLADCGIAQLVYKNKQAL